MKIVDANVLLYATNVSSNQHDRAYRWLASALAGTESIGFPWVGLLAFVRLSTNPRVFAAPLTIIRRVRPRRLVVEPTPVDDPNANFPACDGAAWTARAGGLSG